MAKDNKKKQPQQVDTSVDTSIEVEQLQQQLAVLTEALQRERADAMNLRRRHEEQLAGIRTSVKANVIADLLPVIDNFERALKHVPADLADNDYIKGVQGVVRQFEAVLEKLGVRPIGVVGEAFNPHYHEAVSMEEGDGNTETVGEVLQPGYIVGDDNTVIRHAMVRVQS